MVDSTDLTAYLGLGKSDDGWIDEHAKRYATEVARYLDEITGRARPDDEDAPLTEDALLDSFNNHVEQVIEAIDPLADRRRGDSLMSLGDSVVAATANDEILRQAHFELLKPLLEAEVELRGRLRLTQTRQLALAKIYEDLGHQFLATPGPSRKIKTFLPAHAALAFLRAAGLYALSEDVDAQDRCGLALARARRAATDSTWRRVNGWASDLLCGYGYRPFRLLGWIGLQLLGFTLAVRASSDISITTAAHMSLINFLNPLGLGDIEEVSRVGHGLLLVESYAGTVSNSVFFALLVRRWFRL